VSAVVCAARDASGADPRARLRHIARAWLARRPLYLDAETTGLGRDDEIVEIAILEHDGTPLIDTRLRPLKPIPPEATRVHGIGPLDVQHAPTWPEVQQAVCAALHGRALVIYNAAFDLRMLVQTARSHASPRPPAENAFCAMRLYAEWHGDWNDYHGNYRWQRLGDAAEQMGLAVPENLHAASADAALTRELLRAMAGE
jgi:DNA polymerase III epsilon subunit-like protein